MMELRVGPMLKEDIGFCVDRKFHIIYHCGRAPGKNKNTISKSGAHTFFNITSRDAEEKLKTTFFPLIKQIYHVFIVV